MPGNIPQPATRYINFGIIKDSSGKPLTLTQGVHSVTFTMTGTNPASGSYQAGLDTLRLAPTPSCTINNTTGCFNNTAISTYTAGTAPTVTPANADGPGNSFDATDLRNAGWTPGSTVTVAGAPIKLPAAFGTGVSDNMLSAGQIVTVPTSGVVNKGNAVVFVGFATHGPAANSTGTINYATTSCGIKSQAYTLDSIADWTATPASEAVLTTPRYNKSNATQSTTPISVFAASVPLQCPDAVVESITLPLVTNVPQAGSPTLHFFGLGIRPTSITSAAHWVGSWSAAQDSGNIPAPTSSGTNVDASLNGQTVRIPARLTIGTRGDTHRVRVRVANSLGKTPITFDAASIALQDTAARGPAAAASPLALTFGGAATVTLAAGADLLSDPVTLTVPDLTTVLVSLKVRGNVTALPGHRDGKAPVYTSADSTDRTREQAGTHFTTSAMYGLPFLAGIDVTTPAAEPAGALVLFGDQTVNGDTTTQDGISQLDTKVAAVLAGEDSNGAVPFGVLNQGTSSWGNRGQLPASRVRVAQNAAAQVDRQILSQANARMALISAGSSDLLACTGTADACATLVKDRLVALASQLHQYKTDDMMNPAVIMQNRTGSLKVYVATLPPITGSHTTAQETARELVNAYILGSDGGAALEGYADGVINLAAAVSTDGTETSDTVLTDYLFQSGDNLYPSELYYDMLAQQYLTDSDATDRPTDDESGTEVDAAPIAVWKLDEGTGTTGVDTGAGTGTGHTTHDTRLTDVAWGSGRLIGSKAATFNGTNSYGQTDLKPNTTKNLSVSAWVRLTDRSADRTIFTRSADGYASLVLQYQQSSDRWLAQMPSGVAGDVTWNDALSSAPAQAGIWTHLAAVHDAELHSLTLYVNGVADTVIEGVLPFNDAAGQTWIGRSGSTWFAGDIADVRVWARPTNPAEITDLAAAVPIADWQFEDDLDPTVAKDSTLFEHHGTLTGGTTWAPQGHNDWDFSAATFNGTDAAVTSPALLRTDQSFSVAAWVRLARTDRDYAVASQDGTQTGRFALQYNRQCTCWQFGTANTDQAAATTTQANGPSDVALNTWTHLAGVYDATAGTLTLYINGMPAQTTATTTAPWNATGQFTAGRTRSAGQPTGWFTGDIDAVRAYQGAISADLISELSRS